jgi:hypothetical protein
VRDKDRIGETGIIHTESEMTGNLTDQALRKKEYSRSKEMKGEICKSIHDYNKMSQVILPEVILSECLSFWKPEKEEQWSKKRNEDKMTGSPIFMFP